MQIALFKDHMELLQMVALKRGKLKKGGLPDLAGAAREILGDWFKGKIPFYTRPTQRRGVHLESSVVQQWGTEFDIGAIDAVRGARADARARMCARGCVWARLDVRARMCAPGCVWARARECLYACARRPPRRCSTRWRRRRPMGLP